MIFVSEVQRLLFNFLRQSKIQVSIPEFDFLMQHSDLLGNFVKIMIKVDMKNTLARVGAC